MPAVRCQMSDVTCHLSPALPAMLVETVFMLKSQEARRKKSFDDVAAAVFLIYRNNRKEEEEKAEKSNEYLL